MKFHRVGGFALLVSLLLCGAETDGAAPKLLSIYPSAFQSGSGKVKAEIRATSVADAYAIWFDGSALSARVLQVYRVADSEHGEAKPAADAKDAKPKPQRFRVEVEIEISSNPTVGFHSIRLVTPAGISSSLPIQVVNEPVVAETERNHDDVTSAQAVALPALISGQIERPGQVDYYSFSVTKGQEISIRAEQSRNMDAHLTLFRAGGSWFDTQRASRVVFREDRSSDLAQVNPEGSFSVPEDGRYFLEVSSIYGKGSPESQYLVRIQASGRDVLPAENRITAVWSERTFDRILTINRLTELAARSLNIPTNALPPSEARAAAKGNTSPLKTVREPIVPTDLATSIAIVQEGEPNNAREQAQPVKVPVILEGVISEPGDIDNFKFQAKAGEALAFEIQTPGLRPPVFNPRVSVVDESGHELFSNMHRRVSVFNNNSERQVYLKNIAPKVIFRFEKSGEYTLQIRDLSYRYGSREHRYRVLLRPQIPHIGEVTAEDADGLTLLRGRTRKLKLKATYEEGFVGDVSFSFVGLPPGVEAFPAAEADTSREPTDVDEKAETVVARVQSATVVLSANAEVIPTKLPSTVEIYCRPISNGQPGPPLLVQRIPLIVVDRPDGSAKNHADTAKGR